MTRVHDMGGRLGDGPVVPTTEDAPAFAEEWHARSLALTLAVGALGQWNLDMSRFSRESLRPAEYMAYTYYEKWLAALADLMVAQGVVTRDELAGADPQPSPLAARCLKPASVAPGLARGAPVTRDGPAPRFAPGDRVMTRRPPRNLQVPGGHTRLPGYAAGLVGVIERQHGCHVFPDTHAHGLGECPQPLYTVVFDAADLWGSAERARDTVSCDLWESYLEPAA